MNSPTEIKSDILITDYAMDRAAREIREKVSEVLGGNPEIDLRVPPPDIAAHFAIPCFPYAKTMRKAPNAIAQELADKITVGADNYIGRLEALNGYLNIYLNIPKTTGEIFSDFETYGNSYGCNSTGKGKTVVIDFSSPNIAKPFSVGNIRSTVIGQSIYNIYAANGYKTIGDNHLGDWGTQFGKLLYAYELWGDDEKIRQNPIKELLNLYVKFHAEAKQVGGNAASEEDENSETSENPMENEARKRFKMLEEGDAEATRLWKWFVDLSLTDFDKIYNRLGIHFDLTLGESFYNDKTDEVIKLINEKGIGTREADGSLLIRLDEQGITTPILVQKKDGASLYATRDLAGLIYRIREYNPDIIMYVVGSEQKLYFQQCLKVLDLMGFNTRAVHIDFGMVSLKEGKMSTREGRVIFFEDVIEEAYQRALKILEEKRPDLSPEERLEIAEVVAVGAIKFNDLSQSRQKNVVFDWDKMLAFDGDTAPYLQYSYARVMSLLRKADAAGQVMPELLTEPEEFSLLRRLARFPEAVAEAAKEFAPHIIAQYLIETARIFTEFYGRVPVLKAADENIIATRLQLVRYYAEVMKSGLALLGIKTVERM
ncbi:MAG: arginine--tRNA ligase [Firmicutes bacterium]|nr:arginine--tRNA ligase [Bacillota bacterium]